MSEAAWKAAIEPARPAPYNRLSIAHLLLWIAGTALVVALFPKGWLAGPDFVGDREEYVSRIQRRQTFERLSVVAVAPCYGAAVASLLVAGVRLLWRRPGFPSLPGHWPLVNLGLWILIVGSIVHTAPERDFSSYNLHVVRQNLGAPLVILFVVLLAVAIQAVAAVREPRRWRVALWWQLAAVALPVVALVLSQFEHRPTLLIASMLVVLCWYIAALISVLAGLRDFISRERFDLFHWTGIVCLLGILAHPPLTWLIADVWI
jgi:hypothetical protein